MAVYFIQDATTLAIKIGTSVDPAKRLLTLQTGNANPLVLLGVIPGGYDVEADLHGQFAEFRTQGEWFRGDPTMLDAINGFLNPVPATTKVYLAGKIGGNDWRHHLFGVDAMNDEDAERDGLTVCGPWFVDGAHGASHGRSTHGRAEDHGPPGKDVGTLCKRWLDEADVVFCYLDDRGFYGTLFELGYAHARGIPIFLCLNSGGNWDFDSNHPSDDRWHDVWDDLWLVRQLADCTVITSGLDQSWSLFVGWLAVDATKFLRNLPRPTNGEAPA